MKKYIALITLIIAIIFTGCSGGGAGDSGGSPSADSNKEITAFIFTAADNAALSSDVTGIITGTDIALTVPYGTDVSWLVASFTTTGSSVTVAGITQVSGTTPNDFSSTLTYKVTAEDGSIQDYFVTVNFTTSTSKELTSFSFTGAANTELSSDVTGIISGTDIAVTVPYATDVTSLIATFTTTGESVSVEGAPQISGITPNDYSSDITYRVTAEDGSTQDYTITVTVSAPSTDKELTSYIFTAASNSELPNNVAGAISGTDISVTLPYITDVTSLVASFTTTGASVSIAGTSQVSGTTPNDFSSSVIYRVTAEDGSTHDYTVTVTVEVLTKTRLLEMIANGDDVRFVDTSHITDMSELFYMNQAFDQDISGWDVSNVTDMSRMFYGVHAFNQDISSWNVSSVTDMSAMFYSALNFNQNISGWNVSNVTDMNGMFHSAKVFNQNISSWDVSSVTDMSGLFSGAVAFNQNISSWNVSSVTDMSAMFMSADAFNQNISSWDVKNVSNMHYMFAHTDTFNQDISSWDVSNVTDMSNMFEGTIAYNRNMSSWDVSSVTTMAEMFRNADVFDGDISGWNVSNVTDMSYLFYGADAFNQNISGWNVSSVTDMSSMFGYTNLFNQDISSWDVSSVTSMAGMVSIYRCF